MKKTILKIMLTVFFGLIAYSTLSAQSQQRCLEHHEQYSEQLIKSFQKSNAQFLKQNKVLRASADEYEIPVVVHVLYRTSAENISDAQIQSQIDVLNEDYNKGSLWQNTVADFIGIVGDAKITFTLATTDPQGNSTTGITRKQTTKLGFDYTSNEAKKTNLGGVNPWNPEQYLNLWCVNDITFQGIKNAVLGYAQFPGLDASTDGVVIRYEVFGRIGNLIPGYDEGRTATHEIGHWLGLKHLWGLDGQDGCNANDDDDVSDTPLQGASTAGCPLNQTSCGSKDNIQNFMDYSDDACMTMFTQGQVEKMHYTLNNIRTNFTVSNSLNTDLAINSVSNVSGLLCGSTIFPIIQIQNKGVNTLTSADISAKVDGISVYQNALLFNLDQGAITTITTDGINIPNGSNQSLVVELTNPNGITDENTANNTATTSITLEEGQKLSFKIIEASISPSMNWSIQENGTIEVSSSNVTKTSANGFQTQEFCLVENQCYDFVVTEAFLEDLCSQYNTFNPSTQYQAGEQFVFNETIYEAKQLIWGSPPDIYAHFYNNLGSCPEVNGNDYFQLDNLSTNEIIQKVNVFSYSSPSSNDFCLGLSTSITDLLPSIGMYPNPFNSVINFTQPVNKVQIFDLSGKSVLTSTNSQKITIAIDFPIGVYMAKVTTAQGIQWVKLVKVQK